ncbi:MAG: hypothetical protein CL917_05060 [Deltaproteobacteria bacterium]|nr:hypothetical protein [Deltaproteobacteria bacterium]
MSEPSLESLAAEVSRLRNRIQLLEDREEIHRVTREYMQAMHDARWQDAIDCFCDEASYDHGILGELRTKEDIREFYLEFMPGFEGAGGWAFDMLTNPTVTIDADDAYGRWFLLTLLIDPDTQKPAWSIATLDYEYRRENGRWKFFKNHCIHEHMLSPYDKGWGAEGGSKVSSQTEAAPQIHFERINAQGGKQRPGRRTRSIRGWSTPTLEPE